MQHVVVLRREGEGWRVDVFARHQGALVRVVDVRGNWRCVRRIAAEAPSLLAAGGLPSLLGSIEAMGCQRRR